MKAVTEYGREKEGLRWGCVGGALWVRVGLIMVSKVVGTVREDQEKGKGKITWLWSLVAEAMQFQ